MTTLRSEPMLKGTLVLPSALPVARGCLDALGREGCVHFLDMNAHSLTRQFHTYIQRIEEMERIIRFLEGEVNRLQSAGATITVGPEGPQNFLDHDSNYQLDKVEEALNRLHEQFIRFKSNNSDLIQQRNAALEEKCVMETAAQQLSSSGVKSFNYGDRKKTEAVAAGQSEEDVAKTLLRKEDTKDAFQSMEDPEQGLARVAGGSGSTVSTVAGMVATTDIGRFQRMLFRTTRGNAFCFFQSTAEKLVDSSTGNNVEKGVFVIYYQGAVQSILHEKIVKVCSAFDAKPYDWPHNADEAVARLDALQSLLEDKERALAAYEKYFLGEISLLLEVTRPGGSSLLEEWKMFCQKEKAVYVTLNHFQGRDMTLRCDCWIPQDKEEKVRALLAEVSAASAGDEEQASAFLLVEKGHPDGMPPTYFKTTEFTEPAQVMVDTYGVPRYQEANPAVLTTVTFPFLFGVMYGDIGHGLCVMVMGLWLLIRANALKQDRTAALHGAVKYRYMIFLMGFFAVIGGFMYNDWFALGVDIFGSRWTRKGGAVGATNITMRRKDGEFPYPFGFDPAWKGAVNELLYTNSFKMKFSVIVGFVQMFVGILLKGSNAIFFKEPLDFIFEFIPQVLFICSLVGYMDFLIIYKWVDRKSVV